MTKKTLILLDWDNTINDFGPYISGLMHKVADKMKEDGIIDQKRYEEINAKIPFIPTKSRLETLKDVFGNDKAEDDLVQKASEMLKVFKDENPYQPKAFPNAEQTLRLLSQAYKNDEAYFCILSNKVTKEIHEEINILGFSEYVKDIPIIGGDIPARTKPHPEHALHAFPALAPKLQNCKELEIIFVGDGLESDVEAARRFNEIAPQFAGKISAKAIFFNAYYDKEGNPHQRYDSKDCEQYLEDGTIKDKKDVVYGHKLLQNRLQHSIDKNREIDEKRVSAL